MISPQQAAIYVKAPHPTAAKLSLPNGWSRPKGKRRLTQ